MYKQIESRHFGNKKNTKKQNKNQIAKEENEHCRICRGHHRHSEIS